MNRPARSAALALTLAAVAACGGDSGGGPVLPAARIDFVDGAVEPVLVRGQAVVIEGYGFGSTQGSGTLTFGRSGGGTVAGPIADSTDWSEFAVRTTVPDSAGTGFISLTTADGLVVTRLVHVMPRVGFDPGVFTWQARAGFPRAPVGVALAVAEFPPASGFAPALYAAGGAEPLGGDSVFVPDSGVYIARATIGGGGAITAWARQRDAAVTADNRVLGSPRAFAAAAVATRHNSRYGQTGRGILYVIGGIDATGRALSTVLAADVTADSVVSPFVPLEPLPAPVAGAIALVRRGRLYVIGGADSVGLPQPHVYVARVSTSGQIDGWYVQPAIPGPRAYGGGIVRDERAVAFGGVMDSVPPGAGLDATPARLATADSAAVSLVSGFFTSAWASAGSLLPEPRSQFAALDVGSHVLIVGGMYAGAPTDAAETIAATVTGDSLGAFAGPVGTNTITGLGGGTLVGPAGATWRDGTGVVHGLVLGGMDLQTRLRRTGVWGF